jgi:hypothetical protein
LFRNRLNSTGTKVAESSRPIRSIFGRKRRNPPMHGKGSAV